MKQKENTEDETVETEPFIYLSNDYLHIRLKVIYIVLLVLIIKYTEEIFLETYFINDILAPLFVLFVASILFGIGIRDIIDKHILNRVEN